MFGTVSFSSVIMSVLVLLLFILIALRLNLNSGKTHANMPSSTIDAPYPWFYRQQANPLIKRDLGMNPDLIKRDVNDLGQAPYANMKNKKTENEYVPMTHENRFYSPYLGFCKKSM